MSQTLDPATEQLIQKVISALISPTQKGECKCHWIDAQKVPILLWKSSKNPNLWILKIGTQKFIGTDRSDKNNEMYWRFMNAFETESSAKQTESSAKPTLSPTQNQVQLEQSSDAFSEKGLDQVNRFQAKYGTATNPK